MKADVREGSRREVRDKNQQSLFLFPAAHPRANKTVGSTAGRMG